MEHVSELLPTVLKPELKPLSRIQQRLQTLPPEDARTVYLHSVLCQTMLPYRDPGADVRSWERKNGLVSLCVEAGKAYDQARDGYFDVGLPCGPKARLVLCHLNAEAVRTQSPELELEDSLTAFVKRILRLDVGGRTIRDVKDQLTRLSAAHFLFGMKRDGRSVTLKTDVIEGFELWTPGHENQRMLWPSRVKFSDRYFNDLMQHAVPLNEIAVGMLSHSAMGLDIYAWLAQRLHRIDPQKPAFAPWASLYSQFGDGYGRIRDFRRVFLRALAQVRVVYRDAKVSVDECGITLSNSRPPVLKRFLQIK